MPVASFQRRTRSGGPGPGSLIEARRQIDGAALVGEEQERLRTQVLGFLDAHPDALHRRCRAGHLTGSALVVDADAGRTLLLHHRKLGRWLQPGGHADGDGDLAGVALRESREETGLDALQVVEPAIDLDVHAIPSRPDEPEHLHLDLRFLVLAAPRSEPVVNHESHAVRWVAPHELDRYGVHGELLRLIGRGLAVARSLDRPSAERLR